MKSAGRVFGLRDLLKRLAAPKGPAPALSLSGAANCTLCGYCMPCPYGVDIVAVFSFCVAATEKDMSNWRLFLEKYEKSIPYLRRADRCIGCGVCVSQCPQSIDIPGEMRRIDSHMESLKVKELSS